MSDNTTTPLEIRFGDNDATFVFNDPSELQVWNNDERNRWAWLNDGSLAGPRNDFFNQINQGINLWQRSPENPQNIEQAKNGIKNTFAQIYNKKSLLFGGSPQAHFVFKVREKRGDRVAAGAYAAFLGIPFQQNGQLQVEYLDGLIEAFLYKREVDWTASAHQDALNQLKNKYDEEIVRQDQRFNHLQERNQFLNDEFDTVLKQKTEFLDKLHHDQTSNYAELTDQHIKNLSAIEKAYDQKLALQKPVKYWQTKTQQHNRLAWIFGLIALVSGLGAAGGMGYLAHEYLGKLPPTESPKHWQIGLLVIGAFFSVWLVRIFVRLFFSNVHLATDAAERRMIILTYIAMLREGTQFETEDKKHIIQHIFRSASDGLVKDDAAPPTLFELFTRK